MNPHLQALRFAFRAAKLHAVVVEDAIPAEAAGALRERVRAKLGPYWLGDRGRYHVYQGFDEPDVARVLAEVASTIVEAEVVAVPEAARCQRFVRGDYALYKDDNARWRGRAEPYEVVLDFSAAASAEGQIVYFDGENGFLVPQQPGLLALIDRRGKVQRYDRYLTHRVGEAEVFRLSLPLSIR